MADLFVNDSREDKARAAEVVRLLEDYGWGVFWIRTRAGEPLAEGAEQDRQGVLVGGAADHDLIASRWVRIEAYEALQGEKLVPVLLDKSGLRSNSADTNVRSHRLER